LTQGGTAGIGAVVARELARRGAQIVLLTQHPPSDPFLVEYVDDLRAQTGNPLIYAEHVDLASLLSVRRFATKWVDNAPPRRLDMVILCANTMTLPFSSSQRIAAAGGNNDVRTSTIPTTHDGVELTWGVNYLANFHLLSILSPALRAQPPDRDVRVILAACAGYIGAKPLVVDGKLQLPLQIAPQQQQQQQQEQQSQQQATSTAAATTGAKGNKAHKQAPPSPQPPAASQAAGKTVATKGMYAASKLALATFAQSFQKHLDTHARPDKRPNNARVLVVDPGWARTPGMRRWLSGGSLWGLLLYLVCWPLWCVLLKSAEQGAQSFLFAAMEASLAASAVAAAAAPDDPVISSATADANANANANGVSGTGVDGGGGGSGSRSRNESGGKDQAKGDGKEQGAAAAAAAAAATSGRDAARGKLVKECRLVDFARRDVHDEQAGKVLWEASEKLIMELEKEAAVREAQAKKEKTAAAATAATATAAAATTTTTPAAPSAAAPATASATERLREAPSSGQQRAGIRTRRSGG
jgi:NAD(P)-dependent dehydrogenase (short-subunit alcohol dehydrogenase family)